MELALALGMTVDQISASMTERELKSWRNYFSRYPMPLHRIELYLAQVAWSVARFMGGNADATLSDFIIEFGRTDAPAAEDDLQSAIAHFDFKPRPKKSV